MQVGFSSKLHKLIMELLPAMHRHINPIVNKAAYNGTSLQNNQIKIIAVLEIEDRLTPGQISLILDIQKGSLTRMLKSLLKLGLIEREDDDKDDRKYYLFLTKAGRSFFLQHQQDCDRRLAELFNRMNVEEKQKLEEGLTVFQSYLKGIGG